MNYLFNFPKKIAISLIRIYQRTLSFDHSWLKIYYPHGFCRFHPTCSEYSIQAIERYGLVKGIIKSSWRILRCNPFNKGGYDPLK